MPLTLTREEVRAKLLSYKSQYAKRDKIDIPWLPDFTVVKDEAGNVTQDNRLEVRETMGDESVNFDEERKKDVNRAMGRLVAKCLLMPDTSPPVTVFNESDLQVVMSELGSSVLMPIITKIQELSGTGANAQADAAKNLPTTQQSGSTTS